MSHYKEYKLFHIACAVNISFPLAKRYKNVAITFLLSSGTMRDKVIVLNVKGLF
jgi:hypothetical protein